MILRTLVRGSVLPVVAAFLAVLSFSASAQVPVPAVNIAVSNPVYPATAVSATVTVSGVSGPGTGAVTVQMEDVSLLPLGLPCTQALDASGSATCTFTAPATPGSYNFLATYPGSGSYAPNSNTAGWGVSPWPTQVILPAPSPLASIVVPGTVATFSVQVVNDAGGPLPQGTISATWLPNYSAQSPFQACAPVLLVGGKADCTVSAPSTPDLYTLEFDYAPADASWASAAQSIFDIEVPIVVTNTNASGAGSLSAAIDVANTACLDSANVITDIWFAIPGPGAHRIAQATPLPAVTCSAFINGLSQPGASISAAPQYTVNQSLQVVLDGTGCASCDGISFVGSGGTVLGLSIVNFSDNAVYVDPGSSIDLYNNAIGVDPNGVAGRNGVGVNVDGFAGVGDGTTATGNLVSGNGTGILFGPSGRGRVEVNVIGGTAGGLDGGLGNGTGIQVLGSNVVIDGNAVRYNTAGIVLGEAASEVQIITNVAYDNGGPGIDLTRTGSGVGGDGPTANDEVAGTEDVDTGGNGLQNYPVIQSVTHSGSSTLVSGYLKSDMAVGTHVTFEFYANGKQRAVATGGESYVFGLDAVSDVANFVPFSVSIPSLVDNVSATATVSRCVTFSDFGPLPGCLSTSEYSPTVSASAPGLAPDVSSLQFSALTGATSGSQTVKLTNNGTATTTISLLTVAPLAFTLLTNTCGSTLGPAASCALVLSFKAGTTPGTTNGAITISSDASGSPLTIPLTGFALAPLQVTLTTPASPVAGSTTPITIDVTNPNPAGTPNFDGVLGSFTTTPTGFTVASTNAPTCPAGTTNFSVPAGTTCRLYDAILDVATTPGTYTFTGQASTSAPVATNASSAAVTVTVKTGTLTVTPPSLSFGAVSGTVSAPQSVTLISSTRAPVAITAATTTPFVADASACATGVTNTGCVITVKFAPAFGGTYFGTLTVTDVAGGGTYTVVLSGISGPPPAPFPSLSPASGLSFPARSINTTSPPSTVTLTNTGNANLTITGITVTGDFAFVSSCPATVAPGGSCLIDVRFTPLVAGTRSGVLSISSNAPGSPHGLNLTGQAVAVFSGTLDASPGSLDFGNQGVGTTSAVQTVELVNTGSAAVNLSPPAVSGPFALAAVPPQFSACPPVLGAGGACVIAISFTPTQVGNTSGSLVVSSDASNPRLTVPLAGAGQVAPPAHALSVTGRLDFGSQPFGQRSSGLTLTLTNTTGQPVTVTDIEGSGDFTVDDGCAIVPARATCSVGVYFTPSARGARSGSVTVTVAGEGQPYVVVLTGDGGANPNPLLAVSPSFIGFGNAILGPTQETGVVRLTNVGEVPVLLGAITSLGDFQVTSHCGSGIPVGTTCTIDIAFYPRLIGLRAATLDIPSNAVNGPHGVGLSGVGCSMPNVARSRIPQLVCTP